MAPEVSAPLANGEDLRRAAAGRGCSERAWLRDEGYAGCVEAVGARLQLVTTDETR